jgi:hypothetical protein
MISIALLALIALLLIMLLGRHGVAGTVDKGESKSQTNEINVARECATICSSVRQCHLDPHSPGALSPALDLVLFPVGLTHNLRWMIRSSTIRPIMTGMCQKETFPRGFPGNIPGVTAVEQRN